MNTYNRWEWTDKEALRWTLQWDWFASAETDIRFFSKIYRQYFILSSEISVIAFTHSSERKNIFILMYPELIRENLLYTGPGENWRHFYSRWSGLPESFNNMLASAEGRKSKPCPQHIYAFSYDFII